MATDPAGASAGLLADLTSEEVDALNRRGRKRRFRPGSTLLHEGDDADRVVVITSGQVKVSYFTEDGKEVVLAVRGPGELLGELAALDGEPHSATATALEDIEALVLSSGDFKSFLQEHPRVAVFLLEVLSRRLRDADVKRIEFSAYDSVGRVARRLVELAERFGERGDSGVRISLPLSQEELAGWTGSSREAVSKALQSLRRRGWIETHRRGITVLDLDALARRAT